ncbi:MAG: hypothetical protein IPK82_36695 [Polyangiaceae bacterium]|nr:hypothetical protein [Polyangiaceae bacterium]
MKEPNPYAPPAADDSTKSPTRKADTRKGAQKKDPSYWREGDCVVMNKEGTRLPKRCIVCNSDIAGDLAVHQLSWHPPWLYVFLFCGLLPYAIFAVAARKGARVEFGLCSSHQARRRNGLILAWAGVVLVLVLGLAERSGSSAGVWVGLLMLVALPVGGVRMARVAHPMRIDDRLLWLKVGAPFLESIPSRDE